MTLASDDDLNDNRASTIERFFRGISEFIFHTKLGVVDVQLVDYVSDMMLRFVRVDSLYSLRQSDGMRTRHLVQMVAEAERRIGLAKREVYRHVGDFTLFWSGMYPESLSGRKGLAESPDRFLDYCRQGKRAYAIAAEIEGGEDRPSSEVIQRMSEHFEMCAYGLREIRRHWEDGDEQQSGGLLTW
ncbi:hypothetical protein FYK55_05725 [Roseiconus nitratireducens]|uniref:Uncharacterized protein n=1 Tax=Roseiconus nitratireducens TaxID=2605748 RepID=A0A5M6DCQ9_9BACT|nr:hypothetical protein [Roseiconus nitratireducens]KAA5545173.1 hypothetical protein FYK55_05725 [Roseiconus nitratireducens]